MKDQSQNNSSGTSKERKKPFSRKISRILILIIFSLAVIFLVAIPVLLNVYADVIIGRALQEVIRNETNNAYQIEFKKVGFNLFKREINFQQIHLFNDTTHIAADSLAATDTLKSAAQIDLIIPQFQFKLATIYRAIRHRELIVELFTMRSPQLKIIHEVQSGTPLVHDSIVGAGFNMNSLHSYIKNYFVLLKIDRFAMENAHLMLLSCNEHQNDTLKISNFSLMVSGFHLDSVAHHRKDRLFFSDSMSLQIHEGKFRYRAKLHEVSFDHLDISSQFETVTLKNVSVIQDSMPKTEGRRTFVSLVVPKIEMNGLDVLSILDTNSLMVQKIELFDPELIFTPPGTNPKKATAAEISTNIFEAATAYFHPIKIDDLSISNGKLSLPETPEKFSLPQFDLTIFGISLDSSTFDERSPLFFADDILFSNQNQKIEFNESGWDFAYDKLRLDTRNNTLEISNFVAESPANSENFSLNLTAPLIETSGEDFKNDFLQHTLTLQSFALRQSDIDIHIRHKADAVRNDSISHTIRNLYPHIKKSLNWIAAKALLLEESKVHLHISSPDNDTIFIKTILDLAIDDFVIDEHSAEKQQIFYAAGHKAKLKNLSANLPQSGQIIHFYEAELETIHSIFNIKNLKIESATTETDGTNGLAGIEGSGNVEMAGFDFDGLYLRKGLFIDSVRIFQPDFTIFKDESNLKKKKSPTIFPYFIGEILISGGNIKFQPVDGPPILEAEIVNLSLKEVAPAARHSLRKTNVAALEAGLRNVNLMIQENKVIANIEQIEFSSFQSVVKGNNLRLNKANAGVDGMSGKALSLTIPAFSIMSFPFLDVYNKEVFTAGTISLRQPQLEFNGSSSEKSIANSNGTSKQTFKDIDAGIIKTEILKVFGTFDFDTLKITDAKLISKKIAGYPGDDMNISGLDVNIEQFVVAPDVEMGKANLLFAMNVSLKADNAIFSIAADEELLLKDIRLSTANQDLILGEITIENDQEKSGYSLAAGNVSAAGLDYFELIVKKKLTIESLKVAGTKIKLINRGENQNIAPPSETFNAHSFFAGHLHTLNTRHLEITNATVHIEDFSGREEKNWHFEDVNIQLKHLEIDSTNKLLDGKIFYADDMRFSIHNFSETTATGLYDFGATLIEYSDSESIFSIEGAFLTPNYPDEKFAEISGVQTDRLNFNFEQMLINNFDLADAIIHQRLLINKATIEGLAGDVYRDKSYPFPHNHFPSLPVSALNNLHFPICIDTMLLHNANIAYREYVTPALQPGKIVFTNLNIIGRNITNVPLKIAHDALMRFYVSTRLMDKGKMEVQIDFNLKSLNDEFRANGIVNDFDLTSLNPMLEHVAFVKINTGINELVSFNFLANNEKALGNMRFNYSKLQIRLIDKKKLDEADAGDGFTSFLANTFVVRRNNPTFLGGFREGEIYFSRDVNKSFFNYLAKSALSGLSSTIRGGSEERRERRKLKNLENLDGTENEE